MIFCQTFDIYLEQALGKWSRYHILRRLMRRKLKRITQNVEDSGIVTLMQLYEPTPDLVDTLHVEVILKSHGRVYGPLFLNHLGSATSHSQIVVFTPSTAQKHGHSMPICSHQEEGIENWS